MATLNPVSEIEEKKDKLAQQLSQRLFHLGTPQNHYCLRGVGITRKSHAKTPAQRKQSKLSRRINRGK